LKLQGYAIIFGLPIWIIPPRAFQPPLFWKTPFWGVWHKTPFTILGFHSDNSSEFIHHVVARLLNKLRIQQTKSRSR
jgi:hypothetical protein